MIVFDLMCPAEHRFEGWFASADDFSAQKARNLIACPRCNALGVERVPSASRINVLPSGAAEQGAAGEASSQPASAADQPPAPKADPATAARALVARFVDEVMRRSEDVGRDFPAEARRIYYEEAPARPIRGVASQEEHEELLDEGIPVARLPVPPSESMN